MATAQKPRQSSGTTKKNTPKRSSAAQKKKAAQQQMAVRREWTGAALIVAAILLLLALFGGNGFLLVWLRKAVRGVVGSGVYALAVCLFLAGLLMIVRRKGKIRLRVTCLLLLPILWGAAGHVLFCAETFERSLKGVQRLAVLGAAGQSGGLIAGGLGILLHAAFSGAGAMVILFVSMACCVMVAGNTSLSMMIDRVRSMPPEPEEEPAESKPEPQTQAQIPPRKPMLEGIFPKKRPIDIPLEDVSPEKEGLKGEKINIAPPNVKTPAQVMGVEHQEQKPAFTVAEPIRRNASPEPVLPETEGEILPVVSPAVRRAQEFAARRMQEEQAARAQEAPEEPQQEEQPATQAPAAQEPADRPPWEEKPAEQAQDAPQQAAFAPAAEQTGAGEEAPQPPEWDAPDEEAAAATQKALESALESMPKDTYLYPPYSLLNRNTNAEVDYSAELAENSARLLDTLKSFGIEATLVDITRGPTVTRYEVQLKRGTKFSRVTNLSDDIALSLGAASVRIATIPDKLAVGIEVPNSTVQLVSIREIIDSPEFKNSKSRISFAVGKDITGKNVVGDIKKMPHMLIAGTTGSGKSVCINSLLISLIYKSTPEEVRLIMVDPKMIELGVYNGIPHLLIPVVTDPRKASGALNWAVTEMMRRYKLFSELNVRDLEAYNEEIIKQENGKKLPQIVIVIDELADLMFVAASDVENAIVRIAQMARAAGMHLIIATQRPSADVITGIMKANIPSRISFAVASQIESRIILDATGAEKLLGRGDMLYNPLGAPKPLRVQGCFITTAEIESVVEFIKKTGKADYSEEVMEHIEKQAENAQNGGSGGDAGESDDAEDELMPKAIEVVVETGQASVSMLQRRLKLGYARAARLIDEMEARGIVGGYEGSKPRQLLITREEWREMVMRQQDL